jgi:pimeloyl-ACP methyl ester carboxylesterase
MHPSERRPHLTFLHGQPGAGSDWSALIDQLPDSWDVLAGDRPGYGSNNAGPGDFSANARFVLRELDAAEVAETVLVGHSYGGGVAVTVAAMAPERVRALVLVSSVGPGCLNGWDTSCRACRGNRLFGMRVVAHSMGGPGATGPHRSAARPRSRTGRACVLGRLGQRTALRWSDVAHLPG